MALDPILLLRRYTDEVDTDSIYDDAEMASRAASATSLYAAARDIWIEKAASASGLVNISEGGSSRSLGSVQAQYQNMIKMYTDLANSAESGGSPNSPVLRRISRA